MSLSWKSNFTGTEFRIFRDKVIAGLLKISTWKSEGYGELDGTLLKFKTKGFWQKVTEIRDIDSQKTLGRIQYHFLRSSATITYGDVGYEWRFEPWSRRKWTVGHHEHAGKFKLTGFWQKEGEIENEQIPAAVILASLFVHIHFRKMSAAT